MILSAYIFCQDQHGNVLTNGEYELPGGRLEIGETPIRAATRELTKQTGYKSDHNKLRIAFQGERQDGHLAIVYLVNQFLPTSDAKASAHWMKTDNFIERSTNREFYNGLFRALGIKIKAARW